MDVGAHEADALADAFLEQGAISAEIGDAAAGTADETPVFGEPGSNPDARWARSRVIALLPAGTEAAAACEQARVQAGIAGPLQFHAEAVDEQDWVRITQQQFEPQQITSRLWVVPSWHEPPDPQAINIMLDPGLAFGTGAHPTTRLCLRWLDQTMRGGERVIDLGCGSGILAIAAMKLGAHSASGIDIDPQAITAARENAGRNHVAVRFVTAAEDLHEQGNCVVANILANPLQVLAPLVAGLAQPGARLALSGILVDQADEVMAAYDPWFAMSTAGTEDGWVLLTGVRRVADS